MTDTQTSAEIASAAELAETARATLVALLAEGSPGAAAEALATLHPADQADLMRDIEQDARQSLIPHLGAEALAHIIEHLDGKDRGRLVGQIPRLSLARILDRTDSDVATDVLRHIDRFEASRVLAAMLPANAALVIPLLAHSDESAGGRMTRGYVTLLAEMTADEGITYLRLEKPDAQEVYYLYVLDDDGRIEGVVSLRDLITATADTLISSLMNQKVISVAPDTDQEECARLLRRYNLLALPVVDNDRRLLGVVTADDLMDVQEEEATEDILHLAGLGAQESALSPLTTAARRRIPWLLVNLMTAFLAALMVSAFEDTIADVALLAAFMPIIAGHGGNTGTQAATLVVRGIALGEISLQDALPIAWRGVAFGLLYGVIAGILTAGLALAVSGNLWLASIVLVAMVGNLVVAGLAGALIPFILRAARIDPALASSIWLTTFTDVIGFLMLLGMGTVFVSHLN